MNNLLVEISNTDINIPDDQRRRIESKVRQNLLAPLAPEKEEVPFLLYCMGNSAEEIALKTNWPLDVIYVTAINYKWHEKAKLLQRDNENKTLDSLQQEINQMLMVATYVATKQDLTELLSGKKKASSIGLIPKSVNSLKELFNLQQEAESAPQQQQPHIYAQNAQINYNQIEQPKEESEPEQISEEKRREQEEKYKALRGSKPADDNKDVE